MDLCTNAGIVSDVLKYVTQKDRTDSTLKTDERIQEMGAEQEEPEPEPEPEETTTNSIF
jgi:hypothetical protein